MQYKWHCLFSGNSGVSEFTKLQHWIFAETNKAADATKLRTAQRLIEYWNTKQSRNWRYELIG